MMTLPKELQRQFREDVHQLEEKMPYITDYERLAIEEGYEKGKREAIFEAIRMILEKRFPSSAAQLIEKIQLVDQDIHNLGNIYDCQTIEEIQKLIASWSKVSRSN